MTPCQCQIVPVIRMLTGAAPYRIRIADLTWRGAVPVAIRGVRIGTGGAYGDPVPYRLTAPTLGSRCAELGDAVLRPGSASVADIGSDYRVGLLGLTSESWLVLSHLDSAITWNPGAGEHLTVGFMLDYGVV